MTDIEIIKALECCSKDDKEICAKECPIFRTAGCVESLVNNTLDLIKHQQAVINNLKKDCSVVEVKLEETFLKECECEIGKAKEQTVREFAEKLKARFAKLEYKTDTHRKTCSINQLDVTVNWVISEVTTAEIDSLVNELYGNPE